MLFTGVSEHSIDAKGRLAIPAKYRNQWAPERDGGAWFCVPWPGGILRLYTESAFSALAMQHAATLTPDQDEADLDANLFGLAERLELDGQGRIMIPRHHLELSGLSGEVAVVGARNRLEVRDRAAWIAGSAQRFNNLPTLVSRLQDKKSGGRSLGLSGPAGG